MFASIVSLPGFFAAQGLGIVIGFVVGCFTPSIGRKVKSWIVSEEIVVKKKL